MYIMFMYIAYNYIDIYYMSQVIAYVRPYMSPRKRTPMDSGLPAL